MSVEARAGSLKAKRAFDLVAASLGLILLSPLLLAVAIAIRLTSRGPAIFRQWRHGRNGVPFQVYKFRTLYADAADATGLRQTVANDCRITPLGRFLRKANIDELPQLLNVIQGDMSLVGPRPHPIGMLAGGVPYEDLISAYPLRHLVSPGLTGLAQVRGFRGPTTERFAARGRVFNDLLYVQRVSVFLDLRIIWGTIVQELRRGSGS
jgi:lipopolysaccharide/colanic/teichoic acid biosynthesis glycosyltransferase